MSALAAISVEIAWTAIALLFGAVPLLWRGKRPWWVWLFTVPSVFLVAAVIDFYSTRIVN